MSAPSPESGDPLAQLSPQEREQFAAMVERMRQLRRRRGVPDGMHAQDAIAAGFISVADLEQARWGSGEDATHEPTTWEDRHAPAFHCVSLPPNLEEPPA
jgi:hypothetical protein